MTPRLSWAPFLFLAGLALSGAAHALTLDEWRSQVETMRLLAERDVAEAYQRATQLAEDVPLGATPSDRARALNALARAEVYQAHTEDAQVHAEQALQLALQVQDRPGQAEAYLNLSVNAIFRGRVDDIVNYSLRSMTVLEGVHRRDLQGEAMLRTAMMYRRIGQFDESVTLCMREMEVARRFADPLELAYARQCMAISYDLSGRRKEALEHYTKMYEVAHGAGLRLLEGYALVGLGNVKSDLGDAREGESEIRRGIDLFRAVHTSTGLGFGMLNLAERLRNRKQMAAAMPLYAEVEAIYVGQQNRIGLWFTYNARSKAYEQTGQLAAAWADAESAYRIAQEINFPLYQSESARRLAGVYSARGDYRRAYQMSIEASDMGAKGAIEKSGARMLELAQRYETETKQHAIEDLARRNEQQAFELNQRELKQRWTWTVLGACVAFLLGTSYFLIRLRKSHGMLSATNRKLRQSQAELQELNGSLEQRVQARTGELQRLARQRSEFLTQMSHELRTPLNAILGYAQLLQRDAALPAEQAPSLMVIQKSGEQLMTLIDDFLDSAKIEAGKLALAPSNVPLAEFLHTIAEMIRVRAERKQVAFLHTLPPNLPAVVRADEQRLRQALLNLLSNAVKFTDHGSVVLRVRFTPPGRLLFEVEDTGIGIERGQLDTIFEPFEQAGDHQRKLGGTGLGLFISSQFVRLMGGEIRVESRVDHGSRFWFELDLPVIDGAPVGLAPARGPSAEDLVAPPPEEMDLLYRLAMIGNMADIVDHARHLASLDDRYRPFAERLVELAASYQSKAILALVERFHEVADAN
ncbi:ATP-binding protein [Massilia luteola]|uniref:ATP-binding protein n=1 Tax=Massilia luteola TaxID=3081751 RepID=UPI002ACBE0BB|nr:ATP-binding protein [Massilia sp. Gc5]